ncbi:unnamed protein product [Trypanosoma congolense IL3000]|uniref:WGS project CAEQ00000000 data, annotated contig 1799 n=1 Tax=Trypanosoma congolense (strain IL3000) TaxID=1068625 RepID=F9W8Y5_TRYCI|nr:unnamed protein product [Trypanosoma congolense IL3000]
MASNPPSDTFLSEEVRLPRCPTRPCYRHIEELGFTPRNAATRIVAKQNRLAHHCGAHAASLPKSKRAQPPRFTTRPSAFNRQRGGGKRHEACSLPTATIRLQRYVTHECLNSYIGGVFAFVARRTLHNGWSTSPCTFRSSGCSFSVQRLAQISYITSSRAGGMELSIG